MPLPFQRITPNPTTPTPLSLHDKLVVLLRRSAKDWNVGTLRSYLASGELPTEYLWVTARYIRDKPDLWFVSDDEFIGAVTTIDPACAALLATPAGLDYLHRLSGELASRLIRVTLGMV